MSAPIHSLLADELDLPADQAEKLLGAMLREVRKRARSRGVRLPELGKFREKNGELTFEPSDSLARAVNHRFEGLDSEDLGSAPEQTGDDDEESDEGPSTITLGYQDSSNWSPIDAEEESGESEGEDDEADTAEFEVPSAEKAAAPDEMQATSGAPQQEPSSPQQSSAERREASEPSASSADSADASQTDTEELYPLVEDVPGEADEADARSEPESPARQSENDEEYDRERDTLSDIWGSSDAEREPEEASGASADGPADSGASTFDEMDPFDESKEETEDAPTTEHLDQKPVSSPETASAAAAPSAASEPDPAPPEEPQPEEPKPEEPTTEEPTSESSTKEKSTTLRVFVSLLILILVGGATWYILGQRGITPRPRTTFSQLKAQVQPHLPVTGTTDESGSPEASPSAQSSTSSSATGSASDPQPSSSTSGSESTESTSSSETSGTPSTTAATTTGGSSQQIDPAAGGWTIVVASRTQQAPAQTLANDFRQRFPDQQLPIDVVPGNVENTTRYRVGVGQFDSREAAQQFLDEFGSELPDGAWPLRLQ